MQMSQLYHYQHEKLRMRAVVEEDIEFLLQCVPPQKSAARHPEYKYFIQPNSNQIVGMSYLISLSHRFIIF